MLPSGISSVFPAYSATNIDPTASLNVNFINSSSPVDITCLYFQLQNTALSYEVVPVTTSISTSGNMLTFAPLFALDQNTTYNVQVSGVKDFYENSIQPINWNFSTLGVAPTSWATIMPFMLRAMINDMDEVRYTTQRLQQVILVAAQYTSMEFNFIVPFDPNWSTMDIVPDPTMQPQPDFSFVNLTVMRAAIIILTNEYNAATSQAFSFKEFQSSADMKNVAITKKSLLDEITKQYEKQSLQYRIGYRVSGAAVLTPFNILSGGWRGPCFVYSDRDRFVV